ncbi:MAG: PH domain-containing protein [Haloarculaceae archaeon]
MSADDDVATAGGVVEAEPSVEGAPVAEYTTDERTISARVHVHWAGRLFVGIVVLAFFGRTGAARAGIDPQYVPPLAVALGVLGLAWVHLRYRAWRYRLRDDALYLERGVLTSVRTVVPHVRVQHVDTSRGPMERSLGLSTLVVYTAGSRGADVSIPGLTPEEASDLQRRLKELAIETEGGDAL